MTESLRLKRWVEWNLLSRVYLDFGREMENMVGNGKREELYGISIGWQNGRQWYQTQIGCWLMFVVCDQWDLYSDCGWSDVD